MRLPLDQVRKWRCNGQKYMLYVYLHQPPTWSYLTRLPRINRQGITVSQRYTKRKKIMQVIGSPSNKERETRGPKSNSPRAQRQGNKKYFWNQHLNCCTKSRGKKQTYLSVPTLRTHPQKQVPSMQPRPTSVPTGPRERARTGDSISSEQRLSHVQLSNLRPTPKSKKFLS